MRRLILMMGLPRSGKTTIARELGHPIVSPDAIRLALHGQAFIARAEPLVWAQAGLMAWALFEAGNDTVVIDATNNTAARREQWTRLAKSIESCQVLAVVVDTDPEVCCLRALEDDFPVEVVERMRDSQEPIDWEAEGIMEYVVPL